MLAARVDEVQRRALADDAEGQRLLARLDALSLAAASTAVIGPGLTVTVTDPGVGPNLSDVSKQRVAGSRQIILDRDLQLVVNSLWASGAEAISVDGARIGPNVTIRQAGGAILVDNNPTSSPYTILAIGPPHAMQDVFDRSPGLHRLQAAGGLLRRRRERQCRRRSGRCPPARSGMSSSPNRLGPSERSPADADSPRHGCTGGQRGMIGIAALVVGIVLGLVFHPSVPEVIQPYLPIAVVAALDAVFGGLRAYLERIFDPKVFVVSFVFNVLVAALIVYVGDQLGVGTQLSTAIIVVLGYPHLRQRRRTSAPAVRGVT